MSHKLYQKGAALILVLWAAMFLSLLLAGAVSVTRIETHLTHNDLVQLQVEQAMHGVVDITIFELTHSKRSLHAILPYTHHINGYDVTVEISPEMQKTDVNIASDNQLKVLLSPYYQDEALTTALAAQIADWRDIDDLERVNGAERKAYLQDSGGKRPGNRLFLALHELNQVLDMPPHILQCIKPYITVVGAHKPATAHQATPSPGTRLTLRVTVRKKRGGE